MNVKNSPYYSGKYFILIIFFSFSLTGYAQLKKAPEWVKSIPVTEDAYFGLGSSSVRDHDNYKALARNLALRDLAEKISVSINSESTISMSYSGEGAAYRVEELTELESSSFLSGHQMVEDWTDQKSGTYYTLFKLNRLDYLNNRRNYYQKFDEMIHFMGSEADQLVSEGNLVRGINRLSDAITRIKEELKKSMEPEYRINLEKQELAFLFKLEKQLSRLSMEVETSYKFDLKDPEPLIIKGYLIDNITQEAVSHTNSRIEVVKGDLFHYQFDNHMEVEELSIRGIFPEDNRAEFFITTEINIPENILERLDPTVRNIWKSEKISLEFIPYPIRYEISETDGKGNPGRQVLSEYLRKITDDLGFKENDSSYYLSIEVLSERKTREVMRGSYEGRFDASLRGMINNREVYHFIFDSEKVMASRRSTAFHRAFRATVQEDRKFLVSFVTFLCTKTGQ